MTNSGLQVWVNLAFEKSKVLVPILNDKESNDSTKKYNIYISYSQPWSQSSLDCEKNFQNLCKTYFGPDMLKAYNDESKTLKNKINK